MELLPDGVCVLCDQNTAILSQDSIKPYVKYVTKAFFEKNKQALTEFQEKATNESLCVLCTHKVVISHKFKDYYEDIVKKQSSFKKTRAACFLCDSKVAELISTDDNPNDFTTKIKIFMEASLYPRPFIQCVTCFDCLFYLNIWFDVYVSLMKKLNMEDVLTNSKEAPDSPKKTLRKTQSDNVNHTPATKASILKKDKENVTPPSEIKAEKSAKRVRIASESPVEAPPRKVSRLSLKSNPGKKVITNGESVQSSSEKFKLFLKNELKHLKSIKQINNIAHYTNDVKNDKKFFDEIPYVLVTRNADKQTKVDKRNKMEVKVEVHQPKPGPMSRRKSGPMSRRKPGPMSRTRRSARNNEQPEDNTRKSERINKEPEIIELSDSDNEKKANKEENNKTQTPLKLPFKIKLSAKFQYNSNPKTSKKRGNLSLKQAKHACNVCDEIFIAFCDYKRHALWHEKPEAPKVDVIRHELPTQIKASEFIAGNKKSKTNKNTDPAKISKLVKKYMDETVTELFDDTEFSQPNEIGNIIDNLNTSDSEEKSKQETTDLEKQKDSNKDVTVTENGQPEEAEVEKTEGSENKSDKTEEVESEETTEMKKTKSTPKAQITDDENSSKGSDDEKEESRSKHTNDEKEETRSKDSDDENKDKRSKHLEDEKEETRSKHSDDENEDNRSKHTDDEKEESLSKGSDDGKETQDNEREECLSKSSDDEKEENQPKASDDQKEETRTKDSDEEKEDQSKDSDEEKDQLKDSDEEKDQSKDSDEEKEDQAKVSDDEKESSSLKESDEAEANVSNEIQNGEAVEEKSKDTDDVEVRSDSDRTSVGEDEEKENDSEQTENNSEHNIEKVLAEMHREVNESKETEEADKESGDEACNENGDESFETANGEDSSAEEKEDKETKKKRKRVNSDDEESEGGSGDEVTPKAKKVRFAMDYQSPNKTANDSEGAQSDQETTSSTDVIEENTLRLSEDDNE